MNELSVAVSARVKEMFLASDVVIVLPVLYAAWRPNGAPLQRTRLLLLLSIQRVFPAFVCRPLKITVESASVLKDTSFVSLGVKIALPLALKVAPVGTIAPPVKVARPVTSSVLPRVVASVTPSVPPRVVAPVPTEKVFAPVTEVFPLRLTSPLPVEKVAPIPDCVKSPVNASVPLNVALTADRSPAEVTLPPKEVAPVPRNW